MSQQCMRILSHLCDSVSAVPCTIQSLSALPLLTLPWQEAPCINRFESIYPWPILLCTLRNHSSKCAIALSTTWYNAEVTYHTMSRLTVAVGAVEARHARIFRGLKLVGLSEFVNARYRAELLSNNRIIRIRPNFSNRIRIRINSSKVWSNSNQNFKSSAKFE